MNPPQYILQPVRPWFIIVSLLIALLLNLLPWGRLPGVPDVLALVLLYWNIHQPRRVGIGVAFLLGIAMDVQDASLLGEHALAYTLLSFGAITLHRRVLPLPRLLQALHLLPLLVGAELVPFLIRVLVTGRFPGWAYLIDGFVEALIWPIVSTLLIAPQKRAVDRDDTRPI
ncbi:rod shape-determining protein MreD [Robbsia sp. Bb-Pol-6]|uniref:Rod shape-determining protein MreD n=1 Tax=Robbsia betulipollinis TaxID=2981849 RepID=A0ABT3ZK38_9BURK|nr:rod shape-determining protein MreD [Robbsia betulipollinis]MCY0386894.1 rod shape-determining protein MreD [Robbsia betulipollinis]